MGEAKKKRAFCPVKQGPISPSDCGEHRVSRYACPESCPANPWGGDKYGNLPALEMQTREKALRRLAEEYKRGGQSHRMPKGSEVTVPVYLAFTRAFYRDKDERGLTFHQRWEAEGFAGLNNDQRVLQNALAKARFTLLEVQCVRDAQRVQVADLLADSPAPFTIMDFSLAKKGFRFDAYVTRRIDLPFYSRFDSIALPVPDITGLTPLQVLRETVAHLGGPTDSAGISDWIFDHFERLEQSFQTYRAVERSVQFARSRLASIRSEYRLDIPHAQTLSRLHGVRDLAATDLPPKRTDEGFTHAWDLLGETPTYGIGRKTRGMILLHPEGRIVLEAIGAEKASGLKAWLEETFGPAQRFVSESSEDPGGELPPGPTEAEIQAWVPPGFLSEGGNIVVEASRFEIADLPGQGSVSERIGAFMLRSFLDKPIPALEGRTPRQAAQDPRLRQALLAVVKSQVNHLDRANRRKGDRVDANGMIRELGLDEIDFPPPPFLAPPVSEEADLPEEGDEWDDVDENISWTVDEVLDRIDGLMADYSPGFLDASVCLRFPDLHAILEESFPSPVSLETLEGLTRLSCVLLLIVHYPLDDKALRRLDATLSMDFYMDVIGDLAAATKSPEGSLVDKIAEWPGTIRGISIWMLEKSRERSLPGPQDKQWSLFLHHLLWLDRVVSYWTYG